MPLVKPRTTVDCSGLPVYDFSKLFNKEEIEVRMEQFSQQTTLSMVSATRVKSFEFWVLRFQDLGVFVFEL